VQELWLGRRTSSAPGERISAGTPLRGRAGIGRADPRRNLLSRHEEHLGITGERLAMRGKRVPVATRASGLLQRSDSATGHRGQARASPIPGRARRYAESFSCICRAAPALRRQRLDCRARKLRARRSERREAVVSTVGTGSRMRSSAARSLTRPLGRMHKRRARHRQTGRRRWLHAFAQASRVGRAK
jgi:hypothetical protein